jgi:mannitol-specific phosphotransferase system IIBC component
MQKNAKLAAVLIFYLLLIALFAYIGDKTNVAGHGTVVGAVAGVVLSAVLWFAAGKKWVDKKA